MIRNEHGSPEPSVDLRDEARAALDLVGADPRAALEKADAVVAAIPRQRASPDQRSALSMAHRAAGIALVQVPDLPGAESRLRRAVRAAEASGQEASAAEATMSLAVVLLQRGRGSAALVAIDRLAPRLAGIPAARLGAHRAGVLHELGRTTESLAGYARALMVLRAHGDAQARSHRDDAGASPRPKAGELDPARADLLAACELYRRARPPTREAHGTSDVGGIEWMNTLVLEGRRLLDDPDHASAEEDPVAALERGAILMRAGLTREAVVTTGSAVVWLTHRGSDWAWLAADAELRLAQASLATGAMSTTVSHATAAGRMFAAQSRRPWRVLAEYTRARGQLELDEPVSLRSTLTVIRMLESQGWDTHALDLRVVAAERARVTGRAPVARTLLGTPGYAASARLDARSRMRHAQALQALLDGDHVAFSHALAQAWTVIEQQRDVEPAADHRAMVSGHARDVAELGLAHGLTTGSASSSLLWAERGRTASLGAASRMPGDGDVLAGALATLRLAAQDDDDARLAGRPEDAVALRRARVEHQVVRLSRHTGRPDGGLDPVSNADIRTATRGHVVVEYVAAEGHLAAIVVDSGRTHLVDLGTVAAAAGDIARLEFTIRRMLSEGATGSSSAAADSALRRLRTAARSVDARLLRPLAGVTGDGPLVLAPAGPLWQVPWSVLPSLSGRPVSIVPSASAWCRAAARPRRPERGVLAVAQGGGGAVADDAPSVAGIHGSTALLDDDATVGAVAHALTQHDVVHLAVPGWLRSDNPRFSSFTLVDGPLTGFDLERLDPLPHTLVLPDCRSGEGRALVGEELLGLAWLLHGAGCGNVVAATTTAVDDKATSMLMLELHRGLAAGLSAAEALSRAQSRAATDDPLELATAASFVCTGA